MVQCDDAVARSLSRLSGMYLSFETDGHPSGQETVRIL